VKNIALKSSTKNRDSLFQKTFSLLLQLRRRSWRKTRRRIWGLYLLFNKKLMAQSFQE